MVEVDNFVCLIGKSHYYLYHMVDRYDLFRTPFVSLLLLTSFLNRVFGDTPPTQSSTSSIILSSDTSSLLPFLRDTFTPALYHDRFPELTGYLESRTLSILEEQFSDLDVKIGMAPAPSLAVNTHKQLSEAARRFIQSKLIDYLRENRHHLHMYYIPS